MRIDYFEPADVTRELGGGFEKILYTVPRAAFNRALENEKRLSGGLLRTLCGWYTRIHRFTSTEVLSQGVTDKGKVIEVELVVKRGHFAIAQLVLEHEDVLFKSDGTIRCSCHPGTTWFISRESLPNVKYWKAEETTNGTQDSGEVAGGD